MIEVLDTHRLLYRNAIIRGFELDNRTTPIEFYDYTDDGTESHYQKIGDRVYTNERGYLCYGSNRQKIKCLTVDKSAIIQVSLTDGKDFDGTNGTNFQGIQWIVQGTPESLSRGDIYDLQYWTGPTTTEVWNPTQGDGQLPNYLLRNEYQLGFWEEDTIYADEPTVNINEWTSIIRCSGNEKITIIGTPREGQKILIVNTNLYPISITNVFLQQSIGAGCASLFIAVFLNNVGQTNGVQLYPLQLNMMSATGNLNLPLGLNTFIVNLQGLPANITIGQQSVSKTLNPGNIALVSSNTCYPLQSQIDSTEYIVKQISVTYKGNHIWDVVTFSLKENCLNIIELDINKLPDADWADAHINDIHIRPTYTPNGSFSIVLKPISHIPQTDTSKKFWLNDVVINTRNNAMNTNSEYMLTHIIKYGSRYFKTSLSELD